MMTGSSNSSSLDLLPEQSVPLLPKEMAEGAEDAAVAVGGAELTSVVVSTGETDTSDKLIARVPAAGDGEEDEIQAGPANYGATETKSTKEPKAPKEAKAKGKKSGQKAVADALKTDMAAERTFFKWLWTGLHTGAIGSFIFIAFDGDKDDPMRLVVVGFSWIVALALVLYGTFAYYRRRHALRTGDISVIPGFTREHSPIVVVIALALVIGAALGYASTSGFRPANSDAAAAASAFGGG